MILVTGASGLSGTSVVRAFARQRIPVRALVRDLAKAADLRELPGVEVVVGNMLEPASLADAFAGIPRVLMISGARERMVETQCAFIDAAANAGIEHIVKFSGKESGIGFDLQRFRGTRAHVEIERYLEQSGMAWTHLRPSQFMQFYLPTALTGIDMSRGEFRMSIGDTELAPIDIEDIAEIAVRVMTSNGHEGKAYEMTGPQALSMKEVAEIVSAATGRPVRHVEVPLADILSDMRARHLPEPAIDTVSEVLTERARHPESAIWLRTHELFGVEPTSFADFAERNVAAFLAC
jgi:uncharacterized protein YbjT (DUF2867 family)